MKTGDKRQAAILGVVALLALVFLGSRLLRSAPEANKAVRTSPAGFTVAAGEAFDSLSPEVLGNPFSHSKLATHATTTESELGSTPDLAPYKLPGTLPSVGIRPNENASETRQNEQGPSRISLSAILTVGEPVAIISIDDQPEIEAKAGSVLGKGIKVLSIGTSSIKLRNNGTSVVLSTGKWLDLETGDVK